MKMNHYPSRYSGISKARPNTETTPHLTTTAVHLQLDSSRIARPEDLRASHHDRSVTGASRYLGFVRSRRLSLSCVDFSLVPCISRFRILVLLGAKKFYENFETFESDSLAGAGNCIGKF